MKSLRFGFLASAALMLAGQAQASGWGCGGPAYGCGAPACCGTPVQWVDQKVTAYRCVAKERDVEITVGKMVSKEVDIKWTEYQTVTEPVKRICTTWECVPVEKVYKYTVMQPTTVQEPRKIREYEKVMREVEYKYYETVVTPVKEKRTVTSYHCVPKNVEEVVTVCKRVLVPCAPTGGCGSPCGGCGVPYSCGPTYTCQTVTEQVKVTRCILERVAKVEEIEVTIHKCSQVEKIGKHQVCELKPIDKEIMVNVCKYVPVEQTKTCTVMTRVAKQHEITVNVCKLVPIEKTGKKTVWECIPTKQMVKQTYYVQEPYETIVKVCVPCPPVTCCK